MIWHNITAAADRDSVDKLEAFFWALGAVSVTVADADDEPLYEPLLGENPLWTHAHVVGLFEDDVDVTSVRDQLAEKQFAFVDHEEIVDRQWEREWLKHFQPMRFGQRLWVCPSGMHVSETDAVVIDLDPGLAFGTGTHATTRLCLEWLDSISLEDKAVLDFGCGSGILGLAASLLGAQEVTATDNDPQALFATDENAKKNSVTLQTGLPEQIPNAQYDVVLANILAQPLIELSDFLMAAVYDGGHLVLSGIMESQKEWVLSAYDQFQLIDIRTFDGWVLIHLARERSA
jgi:ribosomal protein L11 methyltransferase|tara:strand:+ start:1041 stop:1907 length:867 start_codon:yes stop_codon:yes gene_type:complete